MSIEKNDKINSKIDKQKLLKELAIDIANKFWIDKEKTEQLIKNETLISLDSLKNELKQEESNENKLNDKKLEQLFFTLKWALELIENFAKLEIKVLKKDINNLDNIQIENFKNKIDDYLPAKLIKIAKNPTKPHEHILWLALGTANSIITTVDVLYKIWKWLLQSPYHLYLIISGKAKTNSFKNI